jgi:hypothetical protein
MHAWHKEVFRIFDSRLARFYSLEWHRRARKTTCWLNLAIREACKFKNRTYLLIGPTKEQERQIVWDDPNMLNAALPDKSEMGWERNEQKLQVVFANGSRLVVRGADDPDSIRGVGPHGVGFDEWALIDPLTWQEIIRPIIAEDVTRWAFFMYTPKGVNHATDMHDAALAGKAEWYATTLRASTSGVISAIECEKARADMPKALYDQEFECRRITEEELCLITSALVDSLKGRLHESPQKVREIVSIDPALGGDAACMMFLRNGRIIDKENHYEHDAMKLVGYAAIFCNRHHCDDVIIDGTNGIGSVVGNHLTDMGKRVKLINYAAKAQDEEKFVNIRAEMYWWTMELMQQGVLSYPEDEDVRRQLPHASRFKATGQGGRMQLETKDVAKKHLGRSPDEADAYVMGQYGLRNVEPKNSRRELAYAGDDWRTA